jgi:hypothetical protein
MRVWGSILVLTVLGGLMGAFWIGRESRRSRLVANEHVEPDPTGEANPSETQAIQGEMARLEAALARTQERLKHIETTKAKPEEAVPASAAASTQQQPTPEQIAQEYDFRARTFDSEPREEAWAKREEEKIASAAKAALPVEAKIENGSCRTSLCKYEIAFSDPEARRPFGQNFSHTMDSEGLLAYHFAELDQRSDGTYPVQVLIFRRGYPMPGMSGIE